jgi:hypothetical protein
MRKPEFGHFEPFMDIIDGNHLDGVVLRDIVTDPHTEFASLTPVNGHISRLFLVVIKNRIRFRTELGTQPTTGRRTNGNIYLRYGIHGDTPPG